MDLETLESFAWAAEDRSTVAATRAPGSAEQFALLWRLDECARGNAASAKDSELTPAQRTALDAYIRDNPHNSDVKALVWRRKLADLVRPTDVRGSTESKDGTDDAAAKVLRQLGNDMSVSFSHSRPSDGIITAAPSTLPVSIADDDALNSDARLLSDAIAGAHRESVPPVRLSSPAGHSPQLVAAACGNSDAPLSSSQVLRCIAYLRALGRLPDVDDPIRTVLQPLFTHAASPDSRSSGINEAYLLPVVDGLLAGMTLEQLHGLADIVPAYMDRSQWPIALLSRMALSREDAEDVRGDAAGAYLDAVAALCDKLRSHGHVQPLVHAVTYHRLRRLLTTDEAALLTPAVRELFKSFVSMPRAEGKFECGATTHNHGHVRMGDGRDVTSQLSFPAPSLEQDEALVESVLAVLLAADGASMAGGDTPSILQPYVHALPVAVMKDALAKVIITGGAAAADDVEAAHAWHRRRGIDSSALTATSIVFKDSNPSRFLPGEDVSLSLSVRGCDRFTVRVFECATTHIYMETGAEIATDLNLDGLEPTHSWVVETGLAAASPITTTCSISLPVHVRGVYVVECVHSRVCTRALVRVGCIRVVETLTCAGHELTLCDEGFTPLPADDVTVHVSGDTYKAGDGGRILVPFSAVTHASPLILTYTPPDSDDLSFSTLVPNWTHAHEWYTLNAAIGLSREAVAVDNFTAALCVRAQLLLHGTTLAPLRALSNVTLTLESRDSDGNASTQIVRAFKLSETAESSHSFAVPHAVTKLSVTLSGDVEILATGARASLSHCHSREYNRVCGSDGIATAQLRSDTDGGFSVYVLGRNGEPFRDVRVDVGYSDHACVTSSYSRTLRTDGTGRIRIGRVASFSKVSVSSVVLQSKVTFDIPRSHACVYPALIHTCEVTQDGVHARLPWPASGSSDVITRGDAALVRLDAKDQKNIVSDAFTHLRVADGTLRIHSLPAGVYKLTLRRSHASSLAPISVTIHVAPSAHARAVAANICVNGHVWSTPSSTRLFRADGGLSISTYMPLHVLSAAVDGDALVARIAVGGRKHVRLHAYATVFVHSDAPSGPLLNCSEDALAHSSTSYPRVRLLASRTLGDEAVYVMKRISARTRIRGNLAPRPSLLLNPWSQRVVSTSTQHAGDGTSHARYADAAAYERSRGGGGGLKESSRPQRHCPTTPTRAWTSLRWTAPRRCTTLLSLRRRTAVAL